MSDLNTVQLSGRLGGDIEIRYTPKGTAVGEVNLAVSDGYGENERTNWIGLVLWGKTAESAAEHLCKGRKIIVSGRLTQEQWEDKETGKKRSKTRVTVERWYFADSEKKQAPRTKDGVTEYANTREAVAAECDDDDIPF